MMFKPVAMRHVEVQILADDLPQASLTLATTGAFHPDSRTMDDQPFRNIPGERYRQLFFQAKRRLEKIVEHFHHAPTVQRIGLRIVAERELDALDKRLGQLWQECSEREEELRHCDEEDRLIEQLQHRLDRFTNLQMDLSLIQGEKTFLDLYVGLVPRDNLEPMKDALGLAGSVVCTFLISKDNAHIVAIGPKDPSRSQLKSVLDSAAFHPLPIPPELRDEPAIVRQRLRQRNQSNRAARAATEASLAKRAAETEAFVEHATTTLALAEPYVDLGSTARCSQQLTVITGWVPARDVSRLNSALENSLTYPVLLKARRPKPTERLEVPTLLSPNRLLTPFTTLVAEYGTPRYGEADPSAVFAVTFLLMFGMMFGDIGHGGIILLGALALHKRLRRFTPFVALAGASSVGFGFLYGNLFGYEGIMPPLWMSPLSDPLLALKITLGWGAGYLVLMGLLSVYNRVVERDWLAAVFESNGVISITLYLGVLWGIYHLDQGESFGAPAVSISIASLLALVGYKWHATQVPRSERFMIILVETFEAIMGSVSNTLSFLRVAAFSFNHVALTLAVFAVAEGMPATGYWITLVLGNLFILVLEGTVVGIQTLRLEYYEGFSRFYAGDGRVFRPLALNKRLRPLPAIASLATVRFASGSWR